LWDRQHNVALGVLRKAADAWATHGLNALSSDAIIAVLLRIYLSEWPEFGGIRSETRDLESWLQLVATASDEVRSLRPNANREAATKLLCAIEDEFSDAISQWALGNPESPATTHALNVIEHILFIHKLTSRPGSSKMPTSLIEHEPPGSSG